MTEFEPHEALQLIARGKLTFDKGVVLRRVVGAPHPKPVFVYEHTVDCIYKSRRSLLVHKYRNSELGFESMTSMYTSRCGVGPPNYSKDRKNPDQ